MGTQLNEADFTKFVVDKVAALGLNVATPQPLTITVEYGVGEPVLTLKLDSAFEEYKQEPGNIDVILVPLTTEVGWTVNGTRYTFSDIQEHSLPVLRDLKRTPFEAEENSVELGTSKGPIIYQELVNRPEERVVAQFVMAKNEIIQPLHTGDMLRSYPDPNAFSSMAVQNLRRVAQEVGLTLSEYQIENFGATPWLVGFRGGAFRNFVSALITVPEVMATLEKTINSEEGLVAILPARDKMIITANMEDTAICEMGLLARYLKDEAENPVSGFVWHFKDGALRRVQTVELADERDDAPGAPPPV
jgi:hypothetical protein